MSNSPIELLSQGIRDVPDFPKPGIIFKDITPILLDPTLFSLATDELIRVSNAGKVDKVVGIDARGFIFGAVVANKLGCGFVPMRKKGKLPHVTECRSYTLEYGEAEIEVHKDAIQPGENVLLIDDLLATGGTASAAVELIQLLKGNLAAVTFLIELEFLKGRERIGDVPIYSIIKY